MLGVAGAEVGALNPSQEPLLGLPLGDDEAQLPVVVGPQELEALEAFGRRHAPRASGEALLELGEPVAGHGDGVDLDDAHPGIVALVNAGPSGRCVPPAGHGRVR